MDLLARVDLIVRCDHFVGYNELFGGVDVIF